MNTYFEVGNGRLGSREEAMKQVAWWKANPVSFSVCEMANTEVTRKTAKGNIITERIRGGLERVPRIISAKTLDPLYIVFDTAHGKLPAYGNLYWHFSFSTRAEAEHERVKRQGEADRLAALTEGDIREVQVPTLADILERDADKIEELQTEVWKASEELKRLKEQASSSVASEVADLEKRIADLKEQTAKQVGVPDAQGKFDAAALAYHKAIHFDELVEEAEEKLHEYHRLDCWPDSRCRVAGECTYDPAAENIEEYLMENAEKFEVGSRT